MSKLPKAPLLEVIYELRWNITNQQDLTKFQYFHGDLYAALKNDYPFRQLLTLPDMPSALLINSPVYRFRSEENGYPLFQLGPGLLSFNTTDATYDWDEYFDRCKKITSSFFKVYQLSKDEKFRPNLVYVDFFKFDFENEDVITFINENLNILLKQNFYDSVNYASSISLGFNYKTELGQLDISLNSGKNDKNETGIVLKTQLNGPFVPPNTDEVLNWLDEAHNFCSDLFKQMTRGQLYESFK